MTPDMTPEEALQLLDQVAAQASLPRQGHIAVQKALEVLKEFVEHNKPK